MRRLVLVAIAAAAATPRHRWVLLSSQRSGTAFLTNYLRNVP